MLQCRVTPGSASASPAHLWVLPGGSGNPATRVDSRISGEHSPQPPRALPFSRENPPSGIYTNFALSPDRNPDRTPDRTPNGPNRHRACAQGPRGAGAWAGSAAAAARLRLEGDSRTGPRTVPVPPPPPSLPAPCARCCWPPSPECCPARPPPPPPAGR